MNDYTGFEAVLFEFCRRHHMAMIQPNADLHYVLFIDNRDVTCYSQDGFLFMQVDSGTLAVQQQDRQRLLKQILQQSLLEMAESAVVVSTNSNDTLVLSLRLSLDHCYVADFESSLGELMNHCDMYCDLLANVNSASMGGQYGMMSVC